MTVTRRSTYRVLVVFPFLFIVFVLLDVLAAVLAAVLGGRGEPAGLRMESGERVSDAMKKKYRRRIARAETRAIAREG